MLGDIANMALGKFMKPFEGDIETKSDASAFLGDMPFGGGKKGDPPANTGSGYYQVLMNTRNKTKPRVEDYRGSWGVVNPEKVGENNSEIYDFRNTKSIRNANYMIDGVQTSYDAKEGQGGLERILGDNYKMVSIPMDKINDPEYADILKQMQSAKFGKWEDNVSRINKQLSKYSR